VISVPLCVGRQMPMCDEDIFQKGKCKAMQEMPSHLGLNCGSPY
jgi:hypothetical protein